MKKIVLGLFILLILSGCSTVTVGLSLSTKATAGKEVSASISHYNFLMLMPADKTDLLLDDLAAQCSSGKVTGVGTQYSRKGWILGLKEEFKATGYCQE